MTQIQHHVLKTSWFGPAETNKPAPVQSMWEQANATLKRAVVCSIAFGCFVNLVQLGLPLFSMQIFDRVLPSAQLSSLYALAGMLVFANVTASVVDSSRSMIMARAALRLASITGQGLQARASKQDTELSLIDHDLSTLRTFISGPVIGLLLDIPWALVCVSILYCIDARLGLFAIGSIMIVGLTTEIGRQLTEQDLSDYRRSELSFADANRSLAGQRLLLTALGILPGAVDRAGEFRAEMLGAHRRYYDRSSWYEAMVRSVRVFLQIGVLTLSTTLAVQHTVNAGAIVASSMLFARALSPFERLAPSISSVRSALKSWRQANSLVNSFEASSSKLHLPEIQGRIHVDQVVVQGDPGRKARLTNISFTAEPGELHLILGDEGAGKSSFAELLCGAVLPNRGTVHLDSMSLGNYDQRQLAGQIGYLPEEPLVRTGSIAALIARESQLNDEAVVEAATMAGIDRIVRELPFGYQTEISGVSRRLSSGQTKRLAFARAIYGLPKLLVLDEPLNGLDTIGEGCVMSTVQKFKQRGCTIVIVSRSPMFLHLADKAWVLDNGQFQYVLTGTELRSHVAPRGIAV